MNGAIYQSPEHDELTAAAEHIVKEKPDLDWDRWAVILCHASMPKMYERMKQTGAFVDSTSLTALQVVPIKNLADAGVAIHPGRAWVMVCAHSGSKVMSFDIPQSEKRDRNAETAGRAMLKKSLPGVKLQRRVKSGRRKR